MTLAKFMRQVERVSKVHQKQLMSTVRRGKLIRSLRLDLHHTSTNRPDQCISANLATDCAWVLLGISISPVSTCSCVCSTRMMTTPPLHPNCLVYAFDPTYPRCCTTDARKLDQYTTSLSDVKHQLDFLSVSHDSMYSRLRLRKCRSNRIKLNAPHVTVLCHANAGHESPSIKTESEPWQMN